MFDLMVRLTEEKGHGPILGSSQKKIPPIYGEDTVNRKEFFDISLFS